MPAPANLHHVGSGTLRAEAAHHLPLHLLAILAQVIPPDTLRTFFASIRQLTTAAF
jgi:hypothetical protein